MPGLDCMSAVEGVGRPGLSELRVFAMSEGDWGKPDGGDLGFCIVGAAA